MDLVLTKFGSESAWLEQFGDVLPQEEIETFFNNYIQENEFQELELNMCQNIASNASTSYDPKTNTHRLNVKTTCNYRRDWIRGVADHEAGTHYLRRYNEKFQTWMKREKYEIKSCLITEEGFAGLN